MIGTMKSKTLKEVVEIIGGRPVRPETFDGQVQIRNVCQDSRLADEADIFFAVKGYLFDGHDYTEEVLRKGCRVMVVEDQARAESFAKDHDQACVILVDSTVTALQDLARRYMDQVAPKTIAITGSVGKTTTRDICHAIFSSKYKTHKNRSNFNTTVGVPLMILEMPEDTEACVLEMGMDHKGEISQMVSVARPNVAIITNIGTHHYDTLGSVENIFRAKMEIIETMSSDGLLVTGRDQEYLKADRIEEMLKKRFDRGKLPGHRFAKASHVDQVDGQVYFKAEITDDKGENVYGENESFGRLEDFDFALPLPGKHNAQNAALAIAAALAMGLTIEEIQRGMMGSAMTDHRLSLEETGGIKIIDDSYNAGPASMRAAMDFLADEIVEEDGKRIAVLGTMLGLCDIAEREHSDLLKYASDHCDLVLALDFPCQSDAPKVELFDDKEALKARIMEVIKPGDVAIFKASHAKAFSQLAEDVLRNCRERAEALK